MASRAASPTCQDTEVIRAAHQHPRGDRAAESGARERPHPVATGQGRDQADAGEDQPEPADVGADGGGHQPRQLDGHEVDHAEHPQHPPLAREEQHRATARRRSAAWRSTRTSAARRTAGTATPTPRPRPTGGSPIGVGEPPVAGEPQRRGDEPEEQARHAAGRGGEGGQRRRSPRSAARAAPGDRRGRRARRTPPRARPARTAAPGRR